MFIHSVSNLTITNICSANRLLNSPVGITTHRYNRERWAVALKLRGKTIYTVNGESILSDSLHPVILPKGCNYSWKCTEPGECIIIEFEADVTATSFPSFEVNDNSLIITAFSKIEKSLNKQKIYHKLECYNHLYEILFFIIKSSQKEYVHPQKRNSLKPAMKYISENYYDSNITNDFLAKHCEVSTVYFRKIFTKTYGTSPMKYLHNFRIKKAEAILQSDYESIEQVAFSIGYNSIYHFSKMFKTYTGKSPTEYAKTYPKKSS